MQLPDVLRTRTGEQRKCASCGKRFDVNARPPADRGDPYCDDCLRATSHIWLGLLDGKAQRDRRVD